MKQILSVYPRFLLTSRLISSSVPASQGLGQSGSGGGAGTLVPKGKVFKKAPAVVALERGKTVKWCSCGDSKEQPFCDGRPMCKPVEFKARESKEYAFCNCKQTNNQPLCDSTHKSLN